MDSNKLWEFLSINSDTIGSIIAAVCTIIATIIAILTYRKANATIFQTEIAKQQTNLLIKILDLFSEQNCPFFMWKIYNEIVICNLYEYGKQYDFLMAPSLDDQQNPDEALENLENLCGGYAIIDSSNVKVFDDLFQPELDPEKTVIKHDLTSKDDFKFDVLFLTRSFFETKNRLKEYISNPFLPEVFANSLNTLIEQINNNLRHPMARTLEKNIKILLQSADGSKFWYQSIMNEFLHQSDIEDHTSIVDELIVKMRKYLKIK